MATQSKDPWRCLRCKQLRKHTAMHCDTCKMPWHLVIDRSYVHPPKSPRRQPQDGGQYQNSWQGQQSWQWNQGDRQATKSPRKGRPRSARGQKNQQNQNSAPAMPQMMHGMPMSGPTMPPMAPMMGWGMPPTYPPPYHAMPCQAPPPPAPPPQPAPCVHPQQMASVIGPNFTMPAMPKMPAIPQTEDKIEPGLLELLQKDVADLPLHIQKAVKETTIKDTASAQKDLQKAAKNLRAARETYENAILARSQLYTNWKKFLSDAVQLWQDYAQQFTDQEQKLQEQVARAKEAFAMAKQISARAHETAGAVQEIHSDEEEEGDGSISARKITETMEGLSHSLTNLQQQAAAIETDEKAHQAKRPRTALQQAPEAPDATMGAPPPVVAGSSPFGKAG